MNKPALLAIVGSLRKDSYNKQVAMAAKEMIKDRATIELLDWADVPFMNQDIEFPAPETVNRVRNAVKAADGIWFFTPEYNHAVPGTLKNLIDWLSRKVSDTEGDVLTGKCATVSGASGGIYGAISAVDQLAALLNYLDMNVMNDPRTSIPHVMGVIQPDGTLAPGPSATFLQEQAEAFVDFVDARRA